MQLDTARFIGEVPDFFFLGASISSSPGAPQDVPWMILEADTELGYIMGYQGSHLPSIPTSTSSTSSSK